jgi:hypothetical protein
MLDPERRAVFATLDDVQDSAVRLADAITGLVRATADDNVTAGFTGTVLLHQLLALSHDGRKRVLGTWETATEPVAILGMAPAASALEAIHRLAVRTRALLGTLAYGRPGPRPLDTRAYARAVAERWQLARRLLLVLLPAHDMGSLKARLRQEHATARRHASSELLAFPATPPPMCVEEFKAAVRSLPAGWGGMSEAERIRAVDERRPAAAASAEHDQEFLSVKVLAKLFGLNPVQLRAPIERWRKQQKAAGFNYREETHPAKGEARYTYRVGAVRPILEALLRQPRDT